MPLQANMTGPLADVSGQASTSQIADLAVTTSQIANLAITKDKLAQTLQDRIVNVKDYGATGDGTTDDTGAIQQAINALEALGGGYS